MDNTNTAYYGNTPHSTLRVLIPKSKIKRTDNAFMILDSFSIWGGADVDNDTHFGWEFPKDGHTHAALYRIVTEYKRG